MAFRAFPGFNDFLAFLAFVALFICLNFFIWNYPILNFLVNVYWQLQAFKQLERIDLGLKSLGIMARRSRAIWKVLFMFGVFCQELLSLSYFSFEVFFASYDLKFFWVLLNSKHTVRSITV